MAAYSAPYKALFIVLLTPYWIPVGTLMKCIGISAAILHDVTESTVRFCELSEVEIGAHWPTGEPLGKAGAYAAQGLAAIFIEEI